MDRIVIEGIKPWDGSYDLDLDNELTTREWGWIKRLAGYLPASLGDDAFGDPEFACVLAAIAIRRAGRIGPQEVPRVFERLADAPFGSTIRVESDSTEEEETNELDPPARSNGSASISGGGSSTSSETPATRPSPTGTPASGTSASAPPISAS